MVLRSWYKQTNQHPSRIKRRGLLATDIVPLIKELFPTGSNSGKRIDSLAWHWSGWQMVRPITFQSSAFVIVLPCLVTVSMSALTLMVPHTCLHIHSAITGIKTSPQKEKNVGKLAAKEMMMQREQEIPGAAKANLSLINNWFAPEKKRRIKKTVGRSRKVAHGNRCHLKEQNIKTSISHQPILRLWSAKFRLLGRWRLSNWIH